MNTLWNLQIMISRISESCNRIEFGLRLQAMSNQRFENYIAKRQTMKHFIDFFLKSSKKGFCRQIYKQLVNF